MNKKDCYIKIEEQLKKIESLKNEKPYSPKFKLWKAVTEKILNECFDEKMAGVFQKRVGQIAMSEAHLYSLYLEELEEKGQALESLLELLKDEDTLRKVDVTKVFKWEYELHEEIKLVSQKLMEDGSYAPAVFEAFKRVINEVKRLAPSVKSRNDYSLMGRVFTPDNPVIKFNNVSNQSEKDEQRGFMHLFQAIVMFRNLKGHETVKLDNPQRAFEYLVIASFLMRKLEERIK